MRTSVICTAPKYGFIRSREIIERHVVYTPQLSVAIGIGVIGGERVVCSVVAIRIDELNVSSFRDEGVSVHGLVGNASLFDGTLYEFQRLVVRKRLFGTDRDDKVISFDFDAKLDADHIGVADE